MINILSTHESLERQTVEALTRKGYEVSILSRLSMHREDHDLLVVYPEFVFAHAERNILLEGLQRFKEKSQAKIVVITAGYTNKHFWEHVDEINDITLVSSLDELPEIVENLLETKEAVVH